ncbi:MAG: aminodeoxychorismate synthase component I [Planctomycetales bacterium]
MTPPQLPLVEELFRVPDVATALLRFAELPGVILFDSARRGDPRGRYSFLSADPFWFNDVTLAGPLHKLQALMQRFPAATVPGLPPFQGGAAGMLAYDLGRAWESIPLPRRDEFQLPSLAAGLYDWVLAWDHQAEKAWIVSHGHPETDPARRLDRAARRMKGVRDVLAGKESAVVQWPLLGLRRESERLDLKSEISNLKSQISDFRFQISDSQSPRPSTPWRADGAPISPTDLAPQFPVPAMPGLTSNFTRDEYLRAVERAIEYIFAGDIFQVNLSQRLLYPLSEHPLALYLRLRERNPAPFAGYFAQDDWAIASASPERFLSVVDGEVETRPIKGTRRRRTLPEADLFTRDELRESEKDRAENVMIVDLLRNDLSRVCRPGTIRVPALCQVETYETVQHLVSEIRGSLPAGRSAWDLFPATFPGGSITGAPKIRAMQIIAELEPTARGPYCGSLFYVGFDGRADSNILIRTFTARRGWVQCPVGGGIVAQSDPAAEFRETMDKAEGMLRALR